MPSDLTPADGRACLNCRHWLRLNFWMGECNHPFATSPEYPGGTRSGQFYSCPSFQPTEPNHADHRNDSDP